MLVHAAATKDEAERRRWALSATWAVEEPGEEGGAVLIVPTAARPRPDLPGRRAGRERGLAECRGGAEKGAVPGIRRVSRLRSRASGLLGQHSILRVRVVVVFDAEGSPRKARR